jgi:hypothetical protein
MRNSAPAAGLQRGRQAHPGVVLDHSGDGWGTCSPPSRDPSTRINAQELPSGEVAWRDDRRAAGSQPSGPHPQAVPDSADQPAAPPRARARHPGWLLMPTTPATQGGINPAASSTAMASMDAAPHLPSPRLAPPPLSLRRLAPDSRRTARLVRRCRCRSAPTPASRTPGTSHRSPLTRPGQHTPHPGHVHGYGHQLRVSVRPPAPGQNAATGPGSRRCPQSPGRVLR